MASLRCEVLEGLNGLSDRKRKEPINVGRVGKMFFVIHNGAFGLREVKMFARNLSGGGEMGLYPMLYHNGVCGRKRGESLCFQICP